MKLLMIILACAWLAACGGGGGGDAGGGIDPRLGRLDLYAAQKLRVLGDPSIGVAPMQPTPATDIPQTGSAQFSGSATLRVEVANRPMVLSGDAALTLDFSGGTSAGTLDNFFGIGAGQQVSDFEGAITLAGGRAAAEFEMSYSGTLAAQGQTLGLDGRLDAQMLGPDMAAIVGSDLEAAVLQGTTTRDATLIIVTEYVPVVDDSGDP